MSVASPASSAATHARDALSKARFRVVLAGLMTIMALAVMDSNIVNTSLPRITAEFGGLSRLTWVVSVFLLTSTIATPLYGKLSDMYGRRRLITVSITVFLAGSVLCGLAQSMTQLIVFRALQGVGAGGLVVLAQAMIGDMVSPRERGRYQGLFTSVFALSSLAGPLIGGALTTYLSWRWIFYVNLPLGTLALGLIMTGLPASAQTHGRRIDYLGAGLLTLATTSLLLLLSMSAEIARPLLLIVLAVVAALAGYGFVRRERRVAEPLFDLELYRNRTFVAGAVTTATMAFALFAALVLIPLYLQLVLGRSPIQAALIITPQIVGMVISSFVGGRAVAARGRVKPFLLAGVALETLALAGLVADSALTAPAWAFAAVSLVLGLGMGMGMPNAVTAVQNAIRREQMGVATGALGFVRSLGGAAGVALTGGIVTLVLKIVLSGEHLGVDVHELINQGVRSAVHLTALERASFIGAYRQAIEWSFIVCTLFMAGALATVTSLPDEELRGASATARA